MRFPEKAHLLANVEWTKFEMRPFHVLPSHQLTWNLTFGFGWDHFPFKGTSCQVPC